MEMILRHLSPQFGTHYHAVVAKFVTVLADAQNSIVVDLALKADGV